MADHPTKQQNRRNFTAGLATLSQINNNLYLTLSKRGEDWITRIQKNAETLQLIANNDYWSKEDLNPFHDAIIKPVPKYINSKVTSNKAINDKNNGAVRACKSLLVPSVWLVR